MTAAQQRARFGAPEYGFRIILVGKDGGVNLSRSSALGTIKVFGTIDAIVDASPDEASQLQKQYCGRPKFQPLAMARHQIDRSSE